MRLLIALAFVASVAASTTASAGYWAPGLSADDIQNGVACQLKKVTVLAKNAGDCSRIGGRLLKSAS